MHSIKTNRIEVIHARNGNNFREEIKSLVRKILDNSIEHLEENLSSSLNEETVILRVNENHSLFPKSSRTEERVFGINHRAFYDTRPRFIYECHDTAAFDEVTNPQDLEAIKKILTSILRKNHIRV